MDSVPVTMADVADSVDDIDSLVRLQLRHRRVVYCESATEARHWTRVDDLLSEYIATAAEATTASRKR